MILPRSPERRAAFLRSSWRDTPTEPVLMLRPNTLEMPAVEPPRDCVQRFQIGRDRMLLVSYMPNGEEWEEFKTSLARATVEAEERMLASARAEYARREAVALQRLRLL